MKNAPQTLPNSPSALKSWFLATRPKTWIASLSPVFIGGGLAMRETFSLPLFFITLLFSLAIQIGTNFANDYFDFLKGADTKDRIGPKRAVQQGWISPSSMLKATKIVFAAAFCFSIPLMCAAGLWSLGIVLLSIICGILYTGGPKPLGYLGLGELFVFVFFGPIATIGAYYVQAHTVTFPVLIASIAPGLLSTAILIANNLRDVKTDQLAGKNTLIVRFGTFFGKLEYTLAIGFSLSVPVFLIAAYNMPYNLLSAACLFPIGVGLIRKAWQAKKSAEFIPLLPGTSFLLICYTALFFSAFISSGCLRSGAGS